MIISGLSMGSPWSERARRSNSTALFPSVPGLASIDVDTMYLTYDTEDRKHRPSLFYRGIINSLNFDGTTDAEFASAARTMDITGITFPDGLEIQGFYEFSDDQIMQMIANGYFSSEYDVPPEMQNFTMDVPVFVDVLAMNPRGANQDFPIVFVDVLNAHEADIDLESSGYDFVEALPVIDRSLEDDDVVYDSDIDDVEFDEDLAEYNAHVNDIFADEEFEAGDESTLVNLKSPEEVFGIEEEKEVEETPEIPNILDGIEEEAFGSSLEEKQEEELNERTAVRVNEEAQDENPNELNFDNDDEEELGVEPVDLGDETPKKPTSPAPRAPQREADDEMSL